MRRSHGILSPSSASGRARSSSPLRDPCLGQDATQGIVMDGSAYWYLPPARQLCLGPGEAPQAVEAMPRRSPRRSPARSRRTFVDVSEETDDTPAVAPRVSTAPRHPTVLGNTPGIPRAAASRAQARICARAEAALRAETLRLVTLRAEAEAAHAETVACVTAATFLATPAEEQQEDGEELARASVDEEAREAADTQEKHEIEGDLETLVEPEDVPKEAKNASSPGFAWLAVKADYIEGVANYDFGAGGCEGPDSIEGARVGDVDAQGHDQTDREAMLTTTAADQDPGLVDRASPLMRAWSPPVPSGCFMAEEYELLPERLNLAESMQATATLEDGLPNHELGLSNTESDAAPESKIRSNITTQLSRGTDRETILSGPSPQWNRGSVGHEGGPKRAGVHGDRSSCSTSKSWRPPPPAEEELPRPAF